MFLILYTVNFSNLDIQRCKVYEYVHNSLNILQEHMIATDFATLRYYRDSLANISWYNRFRINLISMIIVNYIVDA